MFGWDLPLWNFLKLWLWSSVVWSECLYFRRVRQSRIWRPSTSSGVFILFYFLARWNIPRSFSESSCFLYREATPPLSTLEPVDSGDSAPLSQGSLLPAWGKSQSSYGSGCTVWSSSFSSFLSFFPASLPQALLGTKYWITFLAFVFLPTRSPFLPSWLDDFCHFPLKIVNVSHQPGQRDTLCYVLFFLLQL